MKGGQALLAREHDVKHENEYVDECHFCYLVRSALTEKFIGYLAPRQVYGLVQRALPSLVEFAAS